MTLESATYANRVTREVQRHDDNDDGEKFARVRMRERKRRTLVKPHVSVARIAK